MNQKAGYQQYKETQVKTANQGKLLIMLYAGVVKSLRIAKKAMEEDNIEEVNKSLKKAHDIINELKSTLDFEKGGEIAENLDALYDYMNRQLIAANIQTNPNLIDEVIELVKGLHETWEEVIKTQAKPKNMSVDIEG